MTTERTAPERVENPPKLADYQSADGGRVLESWASYSVKLGRYLAHSSVEPTDLIPKVIDTLSRQQGPKVQAFTLQKLDRAAADPSVRGKINGAQRYYVDWDGDDNDAGGGDYLQDEAQTEHDQYFARLQGSDSW